MSVQFQRAERRRAKARIALAGPTGCGKTYTALLLATQLGERIALIDTEKGSADTYADEFAFDSVHLDPPFSPERYVECIRTAEDAGYDFVIVDSLSHAWSDEGGVLDIVDKETARRKGNKFAAWQVGTPAQNLLVNALVRSPINVIATMRTKMAYALVENDKGGVSVEKKGLAPIQREGVEYEFGLIFEMDVQHTLVVSKSRYKELTDLVVKKPGEEFAQLVATALGRGEAPTPASDTEIAEVVSLYEKADIAEAEAKRIEGALERGMTHDEAAKTIAWLKKKKQKV